MNTIYCSWWEGMLVMYKSRGPMIYEHNKNGMVCLLSMKGTYKVCRYHHWICTSSLT